MKASGTHLLRLVLWTGVDGLPHFSVGMAAVPIHKQHAAAASTHHSQCSNPKG